MTKRDRIKNKFGGLCAYSGTPLESDWQIDHIQPVIRDLSGQMCRPHHNNESNMVPCQKIINHYKGGLDLDSFRDWFLGGLHQRLKKLPKEPYTDKSIKKKQYLLNVASYFNISENKPFSGKFYFETLDTKSTEATL